MSGFEYLNCMHSTASTVYGMKKDLHKFSVAAFNVLMKIIRNSQQSWVEER